MNLNQFRSIFFLLLCLLNSPASFAASQVEAQQLKTISPVKIQFSDPMLGRKIAISYHHAILEANFSEGYLIADLSAQERQTLKTEKLVISDAKQWFAQHQALIAAAHSKRSTTSLMKGIDGYDCYPTVEETYQIAEELTNNYPTLASWIDIGDSWHKANGQGGYDLMVMRITNQTVVQEKPKLFIQSSMHAREYTPAALTLDFAKLLLENYQTDADIQWIVDYHEVHLLFQMNPDGRKIAENQIYQRKNTNQNHCPEDTFGVDLNRNFAFTWNSTPEGSSGTQCDQTYRGDFAESEPETQAVSNYIRSLFADNRGPNNDDAAPLDTTGMHLDIHSYSELILWPYGHTASASPNNAGFVELGNKLAWYNDYAPMQGIGLYATDGTSDAVSYGELGVAALTFELGTQFFQACSTYNNKIKPDNLNALVYAAKVVGAPYLLPFGPEISEIELNGSSSGLSITQGTPLNILVTASMLQTKRSGLGRTISRAEYSIDVPVWSAQATPIELSQNEGMLTSSVETLGGQFDTSSLGEGRHTLYVRAYNQNNQTGAVSAVFFDVGANNSPTPLFTSQCDHLNCEFDASGSTDNDGTIDDYQWNFNDEGEANGAVVRFEFSSAGNKSIRLSLTDNSGNVAQKQLDVSVSEPPPTVAPVVLPTPQVSSGGGSLGWTILIMGCLFLTNRRVRHRALVSQ